MLQLGIELCVLGLHGKCLRKSSPSHTHNPPTRPHANPPPGWFRHKWRSQSGRNVAFRLEPPLNGWGFLSILGDWNLLISYAASQLFAFLEETIASLSAFRALQTNKKEQDKNNNNNNKLLKNQKGCLQAVLFPKYSLKQTILKFKNPSNDPFVLPTTDSFCKTNALHSVYA